MAGVAKKDEVLDFKASSKTPADIEAEIAAAASAIGGSVTVGGVSVPEHEMSLAQGKDTNPQPSQAEQSETDAPNEGKRSKPQPTAKSASKKKTKAKSAKKKATKTSAGKKRSAQDAKQATKTANHAKSKSDKAVTKKSAAVAPKKKSRKGKVMSTSDIRPQVARESSVKKAEITFEDNNAPSAVRVSVKPVADHAPKTEKSTSSQPELPNRHGKTIAPLSENVHGAKPAAPLQAAESKSEEPTSHDKAVAITTHTRVNARPIAHPPAKPYAVIHKQLPEAMRSQSEQQQAKSEKHAPHVARIYDTQTYHIPLSVDHHHRKAMFPVWGWVAIIAAGAIGMVVFGFVFGMFNV